MSRRVRRGNPGPYLLEAEILRKYIPSEDVFPVCLPLIRQFSRLAFHPKVTFFVGDNGSGKSTFVEALAEACDLNPEGGSRNFNFASRESHSSLGRYLRMIRPVGGLPPDSFFLRAETYYNVASEVERLGAHRSYGGRPLHEQSHGESFFALFEQRFGHRYRDDVPPVPGLYFLDEPEAALSPRRQLQFLALLHQYCREGSQFIIATHSPILMSYPDAWIYVLKPDGLHRTPYVETDHYVVTKGFLDHPQRTLSILLED